MIYCRKTGSDDWISHKKESAEEIVHTPTEKHPGCFGITCSDLLNMLGKSSKHILPIDSLIVVNPIVQSITGWWLQPI